MEQCIQENILGPLMNSIYRFNVLVHNTVIVSLKNIWVAINDNRTGVHEIPYLCFLFKGWLVHAE